MAFLFADSFDFYSAIADFISAGPWQTTGGTSFTASTNTRFNQGRSLGLTTASNNGVAQNAWPAGASSNTVYLAFAFYMTSITGTASTSNGQFILLRSSATNVVQIQFDPATGNIIIMRGGTNPGAGTVIATYTGAMAAATWNHFQIKIVLDATSGSVEIRKNGNTVNDFTATGLNTSGGTNSVNGVAIFSGTGTTSSLGAIDDLLIFDNSGSTLNTWVGDIRAYTLYPAADTAQKDFTASPTAVTHWTGATTTAQTINAAVGIKFAASYTGQIGTVRTTLGAATTGNVRAYLYSDSAGVPGSLLASSNTLVNPASGNVDFVFPSPLNVTKGTNYWVFYTSDAAWNLLTTGGANKWSATTGQITPTTTTNSPGGGSFNGAPTAIVTYTFTANANAVNESLNDGDASIVTSSTVGALDLYDLDDLPSTPASIMAVQARAITRKSDASARSGQLAIKSGATSALGSAVLQSTSYTALMQQWSTDPNTGAAWTASAINALQAGVKVAA